MCFYHLGVKSPGLDSELRTVWERKITQCATKNSEYQMEIQTFLFSFSCLSFLLFLLYSIAFMLFCFWTCFWLRFAFWLEQMLCLDCSGIVLVWLQQYMCEYIQRLWWKWVFFPYGFSSLWLGLKGQRWYPAHPVFLSLSVEGPSSRMWIVPCVGLDTPAWVNTSWPNHSVVYGQKIMVSWLFDHRLIWDADVPFIWN